MQTGLRRAREKLLFAAGRATPSSRAAAVGSLLLSCLLHVLLGVWTPAVRAGMRARDRELPAQVEITLAVSEPINTMPAPRVAESAVVAPSPRADSKVSERATVPPSPRARAQPTRYSAPHEASSLAEPTPSSAHAPSVPAARPLDLSPQQVARTFLGAADEAQPATASLPARPVSDGANNASVASSLQPAGQGHGSADRDPLLFKRADGGYGYKGTGFDATIGRDGTLALNDHYGKLTPPLVPFQLPDGSWRVGLGGVSFDLTAYMDHLAGNDPYRSERNWFLAKTSGLREKLAQKAADASTRTRLLRLWSAPGLSMRERKLRVFAMWDECTEDVVGEHGRGLIEAYLRDLCQPSDACRFTGEELASLNRQRKSQREFAPYAAASTAKR